MPGVLRLRPLMIREVSFPATKAKGEMDIKCGELHVLKDLNKYTFPDIPNYDINKCQVIEKIIKKC